ncbi:MULTISPECIES: YiiD C-terminal domain-containing protein [unclassified Frankia]|uniref:YiiD C-terminal domain-containing protein n=1 Tax=unclassified Frankia TaxID=2632575 RepID=UPI0020257535
MVDVTSDTRVPPAQAGYAIFSEATGGVVDYERIREITNSLVPFGRFVGADITEVGPDRAVVEIPADRNLTNHLGTVHAGALFLAADIAGAAALAGALAPRLARVEYTVVRDARSIFRKPAVGRVRAIATVDEREARRILASTAAEQFDLDGRALLYDDADVLLAKFHFDYACSIAAG